MMAADRLMAPRQSWPCKLLIVVLHANREHRRDAYATLGSAKCLSPRASHRSRGALFVPTLGAQTLVLFPSVDARGRPPDVTFTLDLPCPLNCLGALIAYCLLPALRSSLISLTHPQAQCQIKRREARAAEARSSRSNHSWGMILSNHWPAKAPRATPGKRIRLKPSEFRFIKPSE